MKYVINSHCNLLPKDSHTVICMFFLTALGKSAKCRARLSRLWQICVEKKDQDCVNSVYPWSCLALWLPCTLHTCTLYILLNTYIYHLALGMSDCLSVGQSTTFSQIKYLNTYLLDCNLISCRYYGSQIMNDFVDLLTFPLAPPWGWHLCFFVNSVNPLQLFIQRHHQVRISICPNTCKTNDFPISLSCRSCLVLIANVRCVSI